MLFKRNKKMKIEENKQELGQEAKRGLQELRDLGVPAHLVDALEKYSIDNPNVSEYETLAMEKEHEATQLMYQAQDFMVRNEYSSCLEVLYKARIASYEATEIHKHSNASHPAIALLELGISQLDKSIKVVEQIVNDNSGPDLGGAIY